MWIEWHVGEPYRVFNAGLRLDDIVDELENEDDDQRPDWAILRRPEVGGLLYAFRPRELAAFRALVPGSGSRSAVDALDLHESGSSPALRPGQPETDVTPPPFARQPSSLRILRLDDAGQPAAVGEMVGWDGQPVPPFDEFFPTRAAAPPNLGPSLGVEEELPRELPLPAPSSPAPEEAEPAKPLEVVLSGEAPKKIGVGKKAQIDIRLETAAGATPLPVALAGVVIETASDVVATLSVDATMVSVEWPWELTPELRQRRPLLYEERRALLAQPSHPLMYQLRLPPPSPGAPSLGAFAVSGRMAGKTTIDVRFQQGMSELGSLSFPVTITKSRPRARRQAAQAVARQPDPRDNDYLVLQIIEFPFGDGLVFNYSVSSEALRLDHAPFQSKPFGGLAGAGGSATRDYVNGIYKRIEAQVLETYDDFQVFDIKLRAISTDMSDQLFDPAFVRAIWDRRDDIHGIKVYSREPHIPWELVRLRHPDTQEVDERYLCEYGLVRNLGGVSRPRTIGRGAWSYLVGDYPNKTQKALSEDAKYLATSLPGRGIQPARIASTERDVLLALEAGAFDVLHIACHGLSDQTQIDDARLIIGDRQTIRHGVQPIAIDALTVQQTAKLSGRGPLVFLNACQSGREGQSLTRLGGWPAAFWQAGAGAFVGASWSVYEKPAAVFASAFYDALLDGATLGEAAAKARAAAKALGDASWLAYLVYGDPNATMM